MRQPRTGAAGGWITRGRARALAACAIVFGAASPAAAARVELQGRVLAEASDVGRVRVLAFPELGDAATLADARLCALAEQRCYEAEEGLSKLGADPPAATAQVDRGGRFSLRLSAAGTYSVWAEAADGRGAVATGVRAGGPPLELRLRRGAKVTHTLKDWADEPVPGLTVSVFRAGSSRGFHAVTDGEGAFELGPLPPGEYVLVAPHPAQVLPDGAAPLKIAGGAVYGLGVGLVLPLVQRGRVLRGDVPVAGASVSLLQGGPAETVLTDGDGQFVLRGPRSSAHRMIEATTPAGETSGLIKLGRANPVDVRLLPTGAIEGTARGADRRPIAGARIEVRTSFDADLRRATTGPDGRYRVAPVPAGRWGVVVAASGFEDEELLAPPVTAGRTVAADAELVPTTLLSGTVLAADGLPLPGVLLLVDGLETWSETDGRFAFSGVAPGAHDLAIGRFGSSYATVKAPGTGVIVRLGAGSVAGLVRDERAAPLPDLKVRLYWIGAGEPRFLAQVQTDGAGRFEREELESGRYRLEAVRADPEERNVQTRSVEVTVGERRGPPVELRFNRGQHLSGRVVDERGAPVAGAKVRAVWARTEELIEYHRCNVVAGISEAEALTGPDGRFRLDGLAAGPHQVRASFSDRVTGTALATPGSGDVELRLRPEGLIKGRLVDWTGAPLPKGSVGGTSYSSSTGQFELAPLRSGSQELRVQAEGIPDFFVEVEASLDAVIDVGTVGAAKPRELTGRILGPDGKPAAGAWISPWDRVEGWSDRLGGEVAADGSFRFLVSPDTTRLRAAAPGLAPAEVALGAGSAPLLMRLGAGATLAGRIDAPGWGALPPLRLVVQGPLQVREVDRPLDAGGRFQLAGLEPGEHTIFPQFVPRDATATPQLRPVRVRVPAAGSASVVITEAAGTELRVSLHGHLGWSIVAVALVPGKFSLPETPTRPLPLPWNTIQATARRENPRLHRFHAVPAGDYTVVVLRRQRGGMAVHLESRSHGTGRERWEVEVPAELRMVGQR